MMNVTQNLPYNVFAITYLPFINKAPGHYELFTPLYTNIQGPVFITFDQPLYIKARDLVAQDGSLNQVVVRLGGFHMLMTFLNCIGHVMVGTGLKEAWSLIDAPNSVETMLHGYAFPRCIRGYLLA